MSVDPWELSADLQKTPAHRSMRYYGFLSGKITNVNDSQGLLRVKARIGAMGDREETDWLIPAFPGSIECKPSQNDPCIVGFIDGDPNRGFWLYHPESTTKQRPSEFMPLGTTLVGVINQIQADLKTLNAAYLAHKHAGVTTGVGTSGTTDTAAAMTSDQSSASDGSSVPAKGGKNIVLSGLCKVK